MYTISFYSFKGGVGRSLALANIGVELAQTGRRVVLVDFDLEAPGLHTFRALEPDEPAQGIIDYIARYREHAVSPDANEFTYEAVGVGRKNGRLWIMPAGKPDPTYQSRLASIDWQRLYSHEEGFLALEDLKEQWRTLYKPDYVLIDSRTGFTDVQGICTRQLPDAVVLFFFPNRQNLDGLKQVVRGIRGEQSPPRNKQIELYFVMSNVPDLDDEEAILKNQEMEFREHLGFERLETIHRYDSLSLVNQVIFARERPKSRLSIEYRKLKDRLIQGNPEDREGAIQLLGKPRRWWQHPRNKGDLTTRVAAIVQAHPTDSEVLFRAGLVKRDGGDAKEALPLLDRALEGASTDRSLTCKMHLERGDTRIRNGDKGGALEDLLFAIAGPFDDVFDLERAIRLIRTADEKSLERVKDSPAVQSLEHQDCLRIVPSLSWNKYGLISIIAVLTRLLESQDVTVRTQRSAKFSLGLAYMGVGRFGEAKRLFDEMCSGENEVACVFNSAMAEWGRSGSPSIEQFGRVLTISDSANDRLKSANQSQCLALCAFVVGEGNRARNQLEEALALIDSQGGLSSFSCWRYLLVTREDFRLDCQAIGEFIRGGEIRPAIFQDAVEAKQMLLQ